jgi:hypothetical protein
MNTAILSSPAVKNALEQFISSAATLLDRPSPEDHRYEAIRKQARALLEQYKTDPLNIGLAAECDRIVEQLEGLTLTEMMAHNRDRSQANIVFISAWCVETISQQVISFGRSRHVRAN